MVKEQNVLRGNAESIARGGTTPLGESEDFSQRKGKEDTLILWKVTPLGFFKDLPSIRSIYKSNLMKH